MSREARGSFTKAGAKKRWAKHRSAHPVYQSAERNGIKVSHPLSHSWVYRMWAMYGLTFDDYKALLKRQRGRCALCLAKRNTSKNKRRLDVDHDHETDRVRGLLCGKCNLIAGQIDRMWAQRAVAYL